MLFTFGTLEIEFIVALALCFATGYLIGLERESRHKDAGVSTHILVISGSMLFTVLSMMVDPASKSRIAANIVTGVGFIGAGLILKEKGNIKNLNTATSLWFSAAIGMAFGFGYYTIGVIAAILCLVAPRLQYAKYNNKKGARK